VKSFRSSSGGLECFFATSRLAILQKCKTKHLNTFQTCIVPKKRHTLACWASSRCSVPTATPDQAHLLAGLSGASAQQTPEHKVFPWTSSLNHNTHTHTQIQENEWMIAHSMNQIFFIMCCLHYTLFKGMLEGAVFNHRVEYDRVFLSSELTSMRHCNKCHNKLKLQNKFFIWQKCIYCHSDLR